MYNTLYTNSVGAGTISALRIPDSGFFPPDTSQLLMRYEDYGNKSSSTQQQGSNHLRSASMTQPPTFGAARAAQVALLAGEEASSPPRPRPDKITRQLRHLEAGTLRKPKEEARSALRDKLRKAVDRLRNSRPKQEAGPSCYERIASGISGPVLHDPVLNGIVTITLAEAQARVREDPTRHAFL
ncbi:hypothetical protein HII31_06572 [Pseudocercospora fuligena]|uniref:Uncharacterized protein n=1 Tax=Pseudocercospora fuligena TaxID=685502 RepID=A0A8H6RLC9_9PEZI|nr:hypothetical protein HII31_06572 [Pseudocercospora fuligena]